MMTKNYFYAIKNTKEIFESWVECEPHVKGIKRIQYKKFKTLDEANAFINDEDTQQEKPVASENKAAEPKKAKIPIALFHKESITHAAKNGLKTIHFVWVRGHKGIDANEMVDRLAKEACGIE